MVDAEITRENIRAIVANEVEVLRAQRKAESGSLKVLLTGLGLGRGFEFVRVRVWLRVRLGSKGSVCCYGKNLCPGCLLFGH